MREVKKYFKVIFSCAFIFLLGNFSFAAKKQSFAQMPKWVTNPTEVFPSDSFLSYVASDTDRKSAELKALQGLSSIFEQSVKSNTEFSKIMTQTKEDKNFKNTTSSELNQNIVQKVQIDSVIGAESKGFWFDTKDTWYAICVLDKKKATKIYSDLIKQNIIALNELFKKQSESLKNEKDKKDFSFEKYVAYNFAEKIAAENENHLKKLFVLSPTAAEEMKNFCPSSKKINLQKMELVNKTSIGVVVQNDVDSKFEVAFNEAISKNGFISNYGGAARYILYATVNFEQNDSRDGQTVRCKYNLSSYILDTKTNLQLAPFSASGREGHATFQEAKSRAVKDVEENIKQDFYNYFHDYLENLAVN